MKRELGWLATLLFSGGCARGPCYYGEGEADVCTGALVVDLSTQPITFRIEGASDVVPDLLSISRNGTCSGAAKPAWEVSHIDEDAWPLSYGEAPAGSHQDSAPADLLPGMTYSVNAFKMEGLFSRSGSASGDWSGFFTFGDGDSFMLTEEYCDTAGGDTAVD
jgi:hypothetical protein